jgi:hypothetical protein
MNIVLFSAFCPTMLCHFQYETKVQKIDVIPKQNEILFAL